MPSPRRLDRALQLASAAAAAAALLLLLGLAAFLLRESAPALREVGLVRLVGDRGWHPTRGAFGMAPLVAASGAVALGALTLALPLALAVAFVRLAYAPPRLAALLRALLQLLAAVPSVVLGFFGLVTVVPLLLAIEPPGASLLAGMVVLALMVLPTLALLIEGALAGLPSGERAAAAALGLARTTVLLHLALPRARGAIGAALLVALGRALGETMAVVLVTGNVVQWPSALLAPVRTLTANLALELPYASGLHRSALFVAGLLLLGATAALLLIASRCGARERWRGAREESARA